jgi:IS5 family transposase
MRTKGKLLLDATCAPADIRYPTELSLLNEAREKTEKTIDTLYNQSLGLKKIETTYLPQASKKRLPKNSQTAKTTRKVYS